MDTQIKPNEEEILLRTIGNLFKPTDSLPNSLMTTGEALEFLKTKNPLVMISRDDLNQYLSGLDYISKAIPNEMERLWYLELNPVL